MYRGCVEGGRETGHGDEKRIERGRTLDTSIVFTRPTILLPGNKASDLTPSNSTLSNTVLSHSRARMCTSSFVTPCVPPAHPPLPPNIRLRLVAQSTRALHH